MGLIEKMKMVNEEIWEKYVHIQDSSYSDYPFPKGLGFVDFLTEHLKERASLIPFDKYIVLEINEKLISVWPFLKDL